MGIGEWGYKLYILIKKNKINIDVLNYNIKLLQSRIGPKSFNVYCLDFTINGHSPSLKWKFKTFGCGFPLIVNNPAPATPEYSARLGHSNSEF